MFVWAGDDCCPILISILRFSVCYGEGKVWAVSLFLLVLILQGVGSMGLKQCQFCVPFDRQARFLILA